MGIGREFRSVFWFGYVDWGDISLVLLCILEDVVKVVSEVGIE